MPLGNGQTQRVTQSSAKDCRCVGSCAREEHFTLAFDGDHSVGGFFCQKYLKDLGP